MRQKNDLIPLAHFVGCNNVPMKVHRITYIYILECDIYLNVGIMNMAIETANQEFLRVLVLKLWAYKLC